MKKPGFLNTVEKKYLVGYGIVGVFSVVFMVIAALCSSYVSERYSDAISELVAVNNLEISVEMLNDNVNMTYLYLTETAVEEYSASKAKVEYHLGEIDRQQEEDFTRSVTDAARTVETYVKKSGGLMEKLQEYFDDDQKSGSRELENQYNELQEVYSYITMRFQNAYSVKLNTLNSLEGQLNSLQKFALVLQIVLLAVAFFCSMFYLAKVIRQVSGSIATMQKGVEAMQENVLEAEPICIESNDEFEEFAGAFNDMTRIIQTQMRELEENADIKEQLAQMEIKNLRMFSELQKNHLDFLQSRVNPHFLFNTLNMISSLARIENADKCAELMETTAAFLRYNLDNISKTVTLEQEVKNLKDYVAIQKCRYGNRYTYYFEVDERCLGFTMPCMILQPMVENAIQHGIAMKMEEGCVWIRVYLELEEKEAPAGERQGAGKEETGKMLEPENFSRRVCLEVCDNGVGMTEAQIQNLYADIYGDHPAGSHIGIRNIYHRLQLFFPDEVRFVFQNQNPGLKIYISLPWEVTK